jgi:hypothetical protein
MLTPEQLAADAEQSFPLPTNEDTKTLTELVQEQLMLEDAVLAAEEELAGLKKKLEGVQERQIPSWFERYGLKTITLTDGSKVEIKDEVHASILKDRKGEAFAWLRTNGYADIVKNLFEVPMTRGEEEKASALAEMLRSNGFSFSRNEKVEPSTLKAFVKRERENGVEFPECFAIFDRKIAKVTTKRRTR